MTTDRTPTLQELRVRCGHCGATMSQHPGCLGCGAVKACDTTRTSGEWRIVEGAARDSAPEHYCGECES